MVDAIGRALDIKPEDGLEFDTDITTDALNTHAANELVLGVIHPGDNAVLWGPSMSGKTFLVLDLGWCIAQGRDWLGRAVQQGAVLYVGLEGAQGIRKRMKAFEQTYGSAAPHFARLKLHVSLVKDARGEEGLKLILQAVRNLERRSERKVLLVIIDTLARAIAGDNENSQEDMMAFIENRAGAISRETGACVMAVHHCGWDTNHMRGSSTQLAAADVVLKAVVSGDGDHKKRELFIEKNKDGEDGLISGYQLDVVEIQGTAGRDGNPLTSCIVTAVDEQMSQGKPDRREPSATGSKVLNEFNHLVISGRCCPAPAGHSRIHDHATLVAHDDLVEQCVEKGIAVSTHADPLERKKAHRKAAGRGIKNLLDCDLLATYGEQYWRPDHVRRGQTGFVPENASENDLETSGDKSKNPTISRRRQPGTSGDNSSSVSEMDAGTKGTPPYKGCPLSPPIEPAETASSGRSETTDKLSETEVEVVDL